MRHGVKCIDVSKSVHDRVKLNSIIQCLIAVVSAGNRLMVVLSVVVTVTRCNTRI